MKNRSIAFKLIFSILACTTLILAGILGYYDYVSRKMLLKSIEANAGDLAQGTAQKIETVLHSIKEVPETLAEQLEEVPYDEALLKRMLHSAVQKNEGIYGATIAFEPNSFSPKDRYYAPYFYRSGNEIKLTWIGNAEYQYFLFDWYQIPKELEKLTWTEPYYDEGGGNIMMTTCSAPFYQRAGTQRIFRGVVTADVSLVWLQKLIGNIRIAKTGYAFLISKNGTFVTHPRQSLIMNETFFGLAEQVNDLALREIGRAMIHGESGFVPFSSTVNDKQCWMAYAPVKSTGWSVAVVFPQDEIMSDLNQLGWTGIGLAAGGFIILFIVIVLIARSITKPVRGLAEAARDIAKGHWDVPLPKAGARDEVGVLTESFSVMREALKKYIRDLTETTAIKERMESELKIAHDIQMNFVPKTFPAFPKRQEFDLYAVLEPAREVGGDLYDFFFIDDERLFFVIGDVSGKGVPAALFMAVTKMLFKANAKGAGGPAEILKRVNQEIVQDNESCIFVTVFCGMINVKTGELVYSNGGHNPPLLLRRHREALFLKGGRGPVLGVLEDAEFVNEPLRLEAGDLLFLYTDGVTESCNEQDDLFSEERLHEFLSHSPVGTLKGFISRMLREIKTYSGKMPQSDDVTMLALRYAAAPDDRPADRMTLALSNQMSSLSELSGELTVFWKRNHLKEQLLHDLNLALEEVIVNIMSYAFPDKGQREIIIEIEKREQVLAVEIWDDGQPFNPLHIPAPDFEIAQEKRPIGGLGYHIVRQLVQSMSYRRDRYWNILSLSMKI